MGRGILVADLSSEPRAACTRKRPSSLGGARKAITLQPLIGGGSRSLRRNEREFSSCGLAQRNCSINDVISRPGAGSSSRRPTRGPPKSSTLQDLSMSRQDANAAFARTSFLYGGNADYIENLYARYETDPAAVDAEWRAFFASLKDARADVITSAHGPSWQRPDWPAPARSELVSALDGDWGELQRSLGDKVKARAQAAGVDVSAAEVQQATRDSIRALMLIRAYRARGHFYADLDPLGLEPHHDEEDLDPRSYGFAETDYDRKIFLDRVLGLEFGTLREILAILRRTYCQTLGVEFMHITDPAQKGWIQ